jgi:membrane protease YdiL (CAAX protease family)
LPLAHDSRPEDPHRGSSIREELGPARIVPPAALVAVLALAVTFPSLITWIYFILLAGHPAMQAAYAVGKGLQFAFPAAWYLGVERKRPRFTWPGLDGVGLGVAFGLLVAVTMMALYFAWLRPFGEGAVSLLAETSVAVREKIEQIGATSGAQYLTLGLFYSLVHSLLEEYYWRWFVFGRLRTIMSFGPAAVLSSLGFMTHHVIVVASYFNGNWPAIVLFSLCVAVGGMFWAWLYQRSGSLLGPWMSHLVVDASLFLLGYDLAWPLDL